VRGEDKPDIAEILAIAAKTVNHHAEHVFKKLGVDDRQRALKSVMDRLAAS